MAARLPAKTSPKVARFSSSSFLHTDLQGCRNGRKQRPLRDRFEGPLELPTGGVNITATWSTNEGRNIRFAQYVLKLRSRGIFRGFECDSWSRIQCNQIDLAGESTNQLDKFLGILHRVIHPS